MSFQDTQCPCGGKKANGTMICDACESEFAGRFPHPRGDGPSLPLAYQF